MDKYDVVIIGSGLAGLTSGLYLQEAGLNVLILERNSQAGGLTSSWQVHEEIFGAGKEFVLGYLEPEDIILQYPMHMIFTEKYPNLVDVYRHLGIYESNLTEPLKRFQIIDSRGIRHQLIMEDSRLPAPLHSVKAVMGLNLGFVDRLSFLAAGLLMIHVGNSGNTQAEFRDNYYDRISMEAFLKRAGMTEKARDFVASLIPSIYNLDSIEVNARRMAAVLFGTLLMSKRGMWYQLVNDNYINGTVAPHVRRFIEAGGTLKLNCEVRRIIHDKKNVRQMLYKDLCGGDTVICPSCRGRQKALDDGFCKNCGLRWAVRSAGGPGAPQVEIPPGEGLKPAAAKHYIAAVRGHQLLPLLGLESPLRTEPYFRNLGREKGACLSIARIFFDRKITKEKFITGASRRKFVFNGCQDIGNIMPRYAKYPGSVFDILSDRAEALHGLPVDKYLEMVIRDLREVWPEAGNAEVKLALGAHIRPDVLYHKETPHLPGERNSLIETPLENLFACNCSLGKIGIGMESAYQSGKLAANRILEQEDREKINVYGYPRYDVASLTNLIYNAMDRAVKVRDRLGKIITSI